MTMSNARSALGYVWEIVEPAAGILVLTVIFTLIMRSPPIGHNFPLFYASGLVPYIMFADLSNKVAVAVRHSKPLLSYPGVTFIDALIAKFLLSAMTKIVIYVLVLGGILIMYDLSPLFDYSKMILGLSLALMLAFSIGTMNCVLFHFFPLWDRIWSLINRPLMLLSGIIILIDDIPMPYRDWLEWNPIVHFVAVVRTGIYPTYQPTYLSVTYVVGIIAFLLPVGLFFVRRYWKDLIDPSK
ncbi:MAG: ABC transporter permease [Paracoccaceae bacterium]|nr:MAG: ABC transporter permease [Paracoccaceae bacterium]